MRHYLSDGKIFNTERALEYWVGTLAQPERVEVLYLTSALNHVLVRTRFEPSSVKGEQDTRRLSPEEALGWIILNNIEIPAQLRDLLEVLEE